MPSQKSSRSHATSSWPATSFVATEEIVRPLAKFHPSVWGDYFLNYTPDDEVIQTQKTQLLNELKDEVRKKLLAVATNPLELLNFIDTIERLGVSYRFEEEIEGALQQVYDTYNLLDCNDNIYHTSLQFRILRQHGFYVSCDIFKKFQDQNGSFNETIKEDVQGMLSLYEASHLRVYGDDILDKAHTFTTFHLKLTVSQQSSPWATKVLHALKQPIHKGMPRLESRHYITFYGNDPSHNEMLLKFAKLDFNLLQSLHKTELRDVSRWWKGLDVVAKLPFIRDRVAEGYFWTLGPFYEPQYSLGRIIFIKVFKVMSIIDDMYDAYGTIEELELFTDAVQKWDKNCIGDLPNYMRLGYQPLLDVFEEFEEELAKEGRAYSMCRAYLVEAKWRNEKYFPTFDEYMNEAAIISFGYNLGIAVCFLGMGGIANKDAFEWVSQNPTAVKASGIIGRLMDDMGSHKFEQSRDHVPSAVECYMRQYGATEEQVQQEFYKLVENAWREINQVMLRPHIIPMPLLTRILNLCRVVDVIYKGEDSYTFANHTMKNNIAIILTNPISM